jgi:hypothetical protein
MGRPATRPLNFNEPLKFYLRRVPLNRGGYDSGGAYWGVGNDLYHAVSTEEVRTTAPAWVSSAPRTVELFLRAEDRDDAKAIVRQTCPHATFFR